MQQLTFETIIAAPAHTVWQVLWNDESYRSWTAVFDTSSHIETDWQQGSYIKFLDDKQNGLYSKIVKKQTAKVMQFKHIAELKKGQPDYNSADSKEWKGAKEMYVLKEERGSTNLQVCMDVPERYHDFFLNTFNQCVDKIKVLSESMNNQLSYALCLPATFDKRRMQ